MSANPEMLQLCMRAFNSYLRATINASDVRTAYYLMNQYRDVAEHLMSKGQNEIVLEIADHLGEYGQIAHEAGLSFLLEAATHDVVQLIEFAVTEDGDCVDALLDVLLELDQEIKEESQEESLLGVRRSQIQLVTLFLMLNQTARAQRIIEDLRGERLERLIRLREGLKNDNRPQYWELTDRGANFRYLPPERRPFLEPLFEKLRGG